MQPYSQPFFWIVQPTATQPNSIKYWFNGLPIPGTWRATANARTVKFWFNGLPVQVIKSA